MDRYQEDDLGDWFKKKGRKPLVIRGARQVGKSTLVRQFCQKNNLTLYEVNLEKQTQLEEVFSRLRVPQVLEALEDILQKKIETKKTSVLFLDEIQATPSCLPCLRYFFEEVPELAVIGAGSLLEFMFNDHEYSMPVGRVEFLHMGPMTFGEFLKAKGETYTLRKIKAIKSTQNLTQEFHNSATDLLRIFLFVGGMPEAISTFISSGIERVPEIHSQILQTYQADFLKYTKKSHLSKIQKVFRYVFMNPCQKIKYANISREDPSRDLKQNLELLFQSRVISPVFHSTCAGIPLESTRDEFVYKTLALDVGLMNHLQGLIWRSFKTYGENEIITKGIIAEQFVGQHLLYQRKSYLEPHLHYWLREGKVQNAEVDFVFEESPNLVAFEVKVGAAGKIRSLHQWMKDIPHKQKKAVRFNFSKGKRERVSHEIEGHSIKYDLITLPLYCIEEWRRFL